MQLSEEGGRAADRRARRSGFWERKYSLAIANPLWFGDCCTRELVAHALLRFREQGLG